MSYFVKFTLSLSLGLLLCGPLPVHAGPVVDYLTEAARYTAREQARTGNGGAGIILPHQTVNKLLKGAKRIPQKDVPSILEGYFPNRKYPNQKVWRLKEADGAQVFFTLPDGQTAFKAPSNLFVHGGGTHGVAVGFDYHENTGLVTLPKNTSRLWATLDADTIDRLKVTREQLRGHKISVSQILETGDGNNTYKRIQSLIKDKQRVRRIDATQVPSFLQNYLNPYPIHPLYATTPPKYFVYREADTKYYFSLYSGKKPARYLRRFITDAYDHVKLWHYGHHHSGRIRIAEMPRGTGASLGKRLETKTLVALGVTREEFGGPHAKVSSKPAQKAPGVTASQKFAPKKPDAPKKTTRTARAPAKDPTKGAAHAR